jgi:hypothetical protein
VKRLVSSNPHRIEIFGCVLELGLLVRISPRVWLALVLLPLLLLLALLWHCVGCWLSQRSEAVCLSFASALMELWSLEGARGGRSWEGWCCVCLRSKTRTCYTTNSSAIDSHGLAVVDNQNGVLLAFGYHQTARTAS